MKLKVDQELCIGCGMCESLSPEAFRMNDEGKAEAYAEAGSGEALESCPVGAISEDGEAVEEACVCEEKPAEEPTEGPAKYTCGICGYVYDPAENDGVAFEDLPEDWVCPICGVGKDVFEKQ